MIAAEHWNRIYETKGDRDVSWFETAPTVSLELIEACGIDASTRIVDVGGGTSRLVDALLARGLRHVTMLDISGVALAAARARLGTIASSVNWIEADVRAEWSVPTVDIWHDRAVFHFLTDADGRDAYRHHLRKTLKGDGHAIIATFALEGPDRCSGLPVVRYSPQTLAEEFRGDGLELIESRAYQHITPWGAPQAFQYSRFRRVSR